jgi:hypothetical protein
MTNTRLVVLVVGVLLVAGLVGAKGFDTVRHETAVPLPTVPASDSEFRGARLETLWIFSADFEDLAGDNAGWTSYDLSGTLGQENYWHKDNIRLTPGSHGDSTWWCGTYNECWLQARGYGNNWTQLMSRDFPLASWSNEDDDVSIEFDQRFAMEHDYDYGYVEVSNDAGSSWTTLYTVTNPGFSGKPGMSQDWDSATWGHPSISLNTWAGEDIRLRFRFESDGAYSSQDEYNNGPPNNSVLDGAWQLDNFDVTVEGASVWSDDVEAAGDNGWVHEDTEQSGNTGLSFYRGLYGTDFDTGRGFTCENRTGWMMGATDPFSQVMVDGEKTYLISPAIDISGADRLVGLWDMWVDIPLVTNSRFDLWLASSDIEACVTSLDGFRDENPGGWYGGPFWGVWTDDWDAFAGNDWFAIEWQLENTDPAAPGSHKAGIFLTRQKVGIPSGDAGTSFTYGAWDRFNDWFIEQMADALLDSAEIKVKDADDIATLTLMASEDDGATWEAYSCRRLDPVGNDWICPPPVGQMNAGSEIHYYFEALDGVGNIATYPGSAPNGYIEFSILPINATPEVPGILLVDKHGRRTPGAERNYRHSSEYYFREALGILGYEWETYDVEVPSGTAQSEGPDSVGYHYYDTIIWFTDEFNAFTFWDVDQQNIIFWLNQAGAGDERNFLVTGNDWCYELMDSGLEVQDFVTVWLGTDYVADAVGVVTVDSIPILREVAGGNTFMDYDDGACIVRGGCPMLNYFDVIQPYPGTPGTETAVEYVKTDMTPLPAGVAYTHQTLGYQTVALGFGMEFMMDSLLPSGYYESGVYDRVNLTQNIMDYFGKTPTVNETDVPVDHGFRNMLSHASPNPFNPVTKIAYSIREAGPVTIEVYNVAGRVVRTLLNNELDAGSGYVMWNGANDSGEKCASGVYFYRIQAPGFVASNKMVMLK